MALRRQHDTEDEAIIADDGFFIAEDSPSEAGAPIAAELSGWLLCWKPQGPTSFDVIRWLKGALRGSKPKPKLGHTGTLDPFAEGLLLVAVGRATRLISMLEAWPKTYEATCVLGTATNTLDPTGEVIAESPVPPLTRAMVEAVLPQFTGNIVQTPPVFSALKQGGEALYKKARRGEAVEVEPRLVTIDRITLLDLRENELDLEIVCHAGTYIRSLCRDLAEALGTVGHCGTLSRTGLGPLAADVAWRLDPEGITPEDIQRNLLPLDAPLDAMPIASLGCSASHAFTHGMRSEADAVVDEHGSAGLNQPLRAYSSTGVFLGIGVQATSGEGPVVLQPQVVLVRPEEI